MGIAVHSHSLWDLLSLHYSGAECCIFITIGIIHPNTFYVYKCGELLFL